MGGRRPAADVLYRVANDKEQTMTAKTQKSDIQGEGNYEAAQHYRKDAERHAKSGKVEQAARDAEPKDKREREQMKQAEEEGRSHAK